MARAEEFRPFGPGKRQPYQRYASAIRPAKSRALRPIPIPAVAIPNASFPAMPFHPGHPSNTDPGSTLAKNPQRDIRDKVEQEDPDFVDRHRRIMDRVKLFDLQSEPAAMEPVHPVMAKLEHQKPQK